METGTGIETGPLSESTGTGVAEAQIISCSSDDMHRHYCSADTRRGVQLVKQRSDSSCRQGYSWGMTVGGFGWIKAAVPTFKPGGEFKSIRGTEGGLRAAFLLN